MKYPNSPSWWNISHDFAWDHIKLEMKRDWNKARNDSRPGASESHRNIIHDHGQTVGISPVFPFTHSTFEAIQDAFRFGYSARIEYGLASPIWGEKLEAYLSEEWRAMNFPRKMIWEQDRPAILYGWNFEANDRIGITNITIGESFGAEAQPLMEKNGSSKPLLKSWIVRVAKIGIDFARANGNEAPVVQK